MAGNVLFARLSRTEVVFYCKATDVSKSLLSALYVLPEHIPVLGFQPTVMMASHWHTSANLNLKLHVANMSVQRFRCILWHSNCLHRHNSLHRHTSIMPHAVTRTKLQDTGTAAAVGAASIRP